MHAQLDRMRPLAGLVDILVSDGGSTDGSVTRDNMEPRQVRSLLVKTGAGQLGSQMRIAFAYALREGYEGVISIDGNDKDDPRSIDDFVTALEDGYGYLQGSRFIEGGRAINTPISRLAAIRFIHAPVVNWSAGFRYTDTTNGFRGYSRQLLADERVATFRDVFQGYELHYYLRSARRASAIGSRRSRSPAPIPNMDRYLRRSGGSAAIAASSKHFSTFPGIDSTPSVPLHNVESTHRAYRFRRREPGFSGCVRRYLQFDEHRGHSRPSL